MNRNQDLRILVLTAAGYINADVAIAACRAGAVGVLNAELCRDVSKISHQIERLIQYSGGSDFGILCDELDASLRSSIEVAIGRGLSYLIVSAELLEIHSDYFAELGARGLCVIAEVTRSDHDLEAMMPLVDGLMLKGHEAGGRVGEESSFILMQHYLGSTRLPIYLRGGVTPVVAAAAQALGMRGVAIDSQVLLLPESPLREILQPVLRKLTGNEAVAVGQNEQGSYFRLLSHPRNRAAAALIERAGKMRSDEWIAEARNSIDWENPFDAVLPLGQDMCFAEPWAANYGSLSGVLSAFKAAIGTNLGSVASNPPIRAGSPFAKALGITYPIIQGPMTRVSDSARFALSVACEGALPMLALALVGGEALDDLLAQTDELLGDKPWGVGLLGFAPADLLERQIATARRYKPNYAIIAGGRPDQAVALEASGIPSFLHVPSPKLLPMFIREGARRFIFEGRECGGHIGPLTSTVLWSSVIDCLQVLLDEQSGLADELMLVFAGGLHDAASSAALQVMVAPLASKGVKVGILMGSAYLFTSEIIESEALVPRFQREVLDCKRTVGLEVSVGNSNRCVYTPFAEDFFRRRRELVVNGADAEVIRGQLDELILGRLRIASKGLERRAPNAVLEAVDEVDQSQRGMYMVGQLACLRDSVTTIGYLHHSVSEAAGERLIQAMSSRESAREVENTAVSETVDIAVVGMNCLLPGASSLEEYWDNILNKFDAITEIPAHRWDWRLYYDPEHPPEESIGSKWGGFLDDLPFDPTRYGMPPKSLSSIDPMQLIALEVARRTIADAGYEHRQFDAEKTSVIIGAGGGTGDVAIQYALRAELPRFQGEIPKAVAEQLPNWSEDTFAGILANVIAGRVSNRLNLGGINCTTDAACASSLAAIYQGVSELILGRSNMVIVGVDTLQGPFSYKCFSETQALSPRGRCSTFDADADGIVISEGLAMLALKRLTDAERDGDRIYCVLKGIAGSSDGRAKGLTAPLPAGQLRAMRGAYHQAGYSPASVGLFEAHGTGTVVGDSVELESSSQLLKAGGAVSKTAVIGSVKTLIGHTKATAGLAGFIKVASGLYYGVLPPHNDVKKPNAVLLDAATPFYLLSQPTPWVRRRQTPRRASVSAFGFGGSNFHLTAEEYQGEYRAGLLDPVTARWPSELFLWRGDSTDNVAGQLKHLLTQLDQPQNMELRDLSRAITLRAGTGAVTAYLCARDFNDLNSRLGTLLAAMEGSESRLPAGMGFNTRLSSESGKVAFLFPGQGSQYPDMLRELGVYFPVCRETLEEADACLADAFEQRHGKGRALSHFIFPRGEYAGLDEARRQLTRTDVAQPALGVVSTAMWRLVGELGLRADVVAGHSYGEFAALHAAGACDLASLLHLSEARGRHIVDCVQGAGTSLGTMAAVTGARADIEKVIAALPEVVVANHNAPRQVVISGSEEGIAAASAELAEAGVDSTVIPVAAAFHSSFVRPAREALAAVIDAVEWQQPSIPVYSNTLGDQHGDGVEGLKRVMVDHLVKPVEFVAEIEAMYRDGVRVFVEVGPKTVLTSMTGRILSGRDHQAVALDANGGGVRGLLSALGELACTGVEIDWSSLYAGRDCIDCKPEDIASCRRSSPPTAHTWMINGSAVRRAGEPARGVGLRVEDLRSLPASSDPEQARAQGENRTQKPNLASPSQARHTGSRAGGDGENTRVSVSRTETTYDAGSTKREEPRAMTKHVPPIQLESPVMAEYFATMRQFLQTQETIMSHYLAGSRSLDHTRLSGARPAGRGPVRRPEVAVLPGLDVSSAMPQPSEQAEIHRGYVPDSFAESPPVSDRRPEPEPPPTAMQDVPQAVPNEPATQLDRDGLTDRLLAIIEDTTGYPRDMLAMDQNLEGELGIDSIKRVEIIGSLMQSLPAASADAVGDGRKDLVAAESINELLDRLLEKLALEEPASPFNQAGDGRNTADKRRCSRHVIVPSFESIPTSASFMSPGGNILITADQRGVADALCQRFRDKGCTVHLVQVDDLLSEGVAPILLERLSSIDGLIHLHPIGARWLEPTASLADFDDQLESNELAFFILLSSVLAKLSPRAGVMAVSALGGQFLHRPKPVQGLSVQGGTVGLLKTLVEERPDLRARAVDLDLSIEMDCIVDDLWREYTLLGGRLEVGYCAGQRTIFKTQKTAATKRFSENTLASEPLVVLATGGARGVTAETLRPLARPGNTLILTGRSELAEEPDETAVLSSREALQAHFIEHARSGRVSLNPAQIKRQVDAILAQREMRNNIAQFRSAGAEVVYCPVDVTDEPAMTEFMAGLYEQYPVIHGVVHGAGVIEDKRVEDKTSQSWRRVVHTKIRGLVLLQKLLRVDGLQFFAAFSSVAGRYGNSGQGDYATANELMNRLCQQLQVLWGDQVTLLALCWGPWGATRYGSGMVTPAVEAGFAEKGIALVQAEQGAELFVNELVADQDAVEVVLGEGLWELKEAELGVWQEFVPRTPSSGDKISDLRDVRVASGETTPSGGSSALLM